jgi:hypothetical protein
MILPFCSPPLGLIKNKKTKQQANEDTLKHQNNKHVQLSSPLPLGFAAHQQQCNIRRW